MNLPSAIPLNAAATRGRTAHQHRAPAPAARTQSISRAIDIVTLVRCFNISGLRLQDILDASCLSKSTAHRLLQELTANGLLRKTPQGRYKLGRLSYELGLAASIDYNVLDLCGPELDQIAKATGDTVFLAVRSGNDSLCVDKRAGRSGLVRPIGLSKGHLQPLGLGAGGLAILSFLPHAQRDAIIQANGPRLSLYDGLSPSSLVRRVDETRRLGYSCMANFVVPDVSSIGIALLDRTGRPMVAISVAARAASMTTAHRREIFLTLSAAGKNLREKLLVNYSSVLLLA